MQRKFNAQQIQCTSVLMCPRIEPRPHARPRPLNPMQSACRDDACSAAATHLEGAEGDAQLGQVELAPGDAPFAAVQPQYGTSGEVVGVVVSWGGVVDLPGVFFCFVPAMTRSP